MSINQPALWKEVAPLVEATEGYLSLEEAKFLFDAAASRKGRGAIVEIGSWKGRSTICLAAGAPPNTKVYAIDPHSGSSEHQQQMGKVDTLEEFRENIKRAGVEDRVVALVETSEQAAEKWQGKVELLFIDGAHEYELVKKDYELWGPHLIEGGMIAFHDTVDWYGPKQLVKENIFLGPYYADAGLVGSITYARKVAKCGLAETVKKRWLLFIKQFYDYGRTHRLPGWIKGPGKRILSRI
jgi:predicted O-methyltransferase YrrM